MNIQELKDRLIEKRNKVKRCPLCNSNVEDRIISLYAGLIRSLHKIYKHCGEKGWHEFETKDVKHLLGKNEYARFGDLVRFGGLVYKAKDEDGKSRKGLFGLNMERCAEFFKGQRDIPIQITVNQITNEIVSERMVKIDQFKNAELVTYLDEHGLYDSKRIINV